MLSLVSVGKYDNRRRKSVEAACYMLGWYFFSLSISIYNKWMFGNGLNFKFPVLVTSFHQMCLMVLSTAILYFNPRLQPTINGTGVEKRRDLGQFINSMKMEIPAYARHIVPCALASSGDIGLSNVSFKYITLSLYTMLKSSSLMFVLLFGLIFRLEKFNWRLILIVITMSISVLMMVQRPSLSDDTENTGFGIGLVLWASVTSGLRWSFTQLLLKQNAYTNNSISTIFYLSPSMCLTLFFLGLIFEGWNNFIYAPIWQIMGVGKTLVLMIVPGILAFMMTLCEFKLLSVAQVITLSVAGIFKELLTIVVSLFIFGDKLTFLNYMGLVLTFADILWYNYHRHFENADEILVRSKNENHDIELN
ncbi:uncharacterized protein PRCAT00006311001 [Priceomyces carsonii]|uniref:uncharacterized protein n=1 Tax=Priceomyces carsonii TaxID=28549 RepID=UPI002EDA7116|nr:unnamed protein product [Priceomyces carsonii]